MKFFVLTCVFWGLLFLIAGCAKQETQSTSQGATPAASEEHNVMKPVAEEQPAATESVEAAKPAAESAEATGAAKPPETATDQP